MKNKVAIYDCVYSDLPEDLVRISEMEKELVRLGMEPAATFLDVKQDRLKPRSGYLDLWENLKAGRVEAVMVYSLERLASTMKELFTLIDFFEKNDVVLISLWDGINTSIGSQKWFFSVSHSFRAIDKNERSFKVRKGMAKAKKNGVTLGRPGIEAPTLRMVLKYLLEYLSSPETSYQPKQICARTGISSSTFHGIKGVVEQLVLGVSFEKACEGTTVGTNTLQTVYELYETYEKDFLADVPEL